jgi:hypothetical protein
MAARGPSASENSVAADVGGPDPDEEPTLIIAAVRMEVLEPSHLLVVSVLGPDSCRCTAKSEFLIRDLPREVLASSDLWYAGDEA